MIHDEIAIMLGYGLLIIKDGNLKMPGRYLKLSFLTDTLPFSPHSVSQSKSRDQTKSEDKSLAHLRVTGVHCHI